MRALSTLPMFPLELAMLPGETLPLRIFEPRYAALVRACLDAADRAFGVVLIARGREVGGGDDRYDVGALAWIEQFANLGAGRYQLLCQVQDRFRVTEWLPDDPFPRARVRRWPDEPAAVDAADLAALEDDIWSLLEFLARRQHIELASRSSILGALPTEPGSRLYALAGYIPIGPADKYSVLAAPDPAQRLTALREAVETVSAMARFQASTPD